MLCCGAWVRDTLDGIHGGAEGTKSENLHGQTSSRIMGKKVGARDQCADRRSNKRHNSQHNVCFDITIAQYGSRFGTPKSAR